MKELSKGCKRSWVPYKNPRTEVTIWANEAIKLGRSLMPNAILPTNYVYHYVPEKLNIYAQPPEATNRMLRNLLDDNGSSKEFPNSPISKDPEDDRRLLRHTRSYYRKTTK